MKNVEMGKKGTSVQLPDVSYLQECRLGVRPMDLKMTGYDQIRSRMLPGKDDEKQHPEITLAAAMMLRHPMVQTEGVRFTDWEVEGINQGIYLVTNETSGDKYQYALRSAFRENGEMVVLWALGDWNGTNFGYFETEKVGEHDYKVKPEAFGVRHFYLAERHDPGMKFKAAKIGENNEGLW